MIALPAVLQIKRKRGVVPRQRRRRSRVERVGGPAFGLAAGENILSFFRAQSIARRVAGAAVSKAVGEIGAAVPLGIPVRVGLIAPGAQEQKLPSGDERPQV